MLPLTEPLTRFIYRKDWIGDNNDVAAVAFKPSPSDGKTSLFQIAGITEPQITAIGVGIGERRRRPVPLLGRAELVAGTIYEQELDIELDKPPSRHANIGGWPEEEEAILDVALQLALGSTLRLVS